MKKSKPTSNYNPDTIKADLKAFRYERTRSAVADEIRKRFKMNSKKSMTVKENLISEISSNLLNNYIDKTQVDLKKRNKNNQDLASREELTKLIKKRAGIVSLAPWAAAQRMKKKLTKEQVEEEEFNFMAARRIKKEYLADKARIRELCGPEKRSDEEMAELARLIQKQNKRKFPTTKVSEALETGSKPPNGDQNVLPNLRTAQQILKLRGVDMVQAAKGHKDFEKVIAKNPKIPAYMLLRKISPQRATALQAVTQAGVPLGASLKSKQSEFNQLLQRIKKFRS